MYFCPNILNVCVQYAYMSVWVSNDGMGVKCEPSFAIFFPPENKGHHYF